MGLRDPTVRCLQSNWSDNASNSYSYGKLASDWLRLPFKSVNQTVPSALDANKRCLFISENES